MVMVTTVIKMLLLLLLAERDRLDRNHLNKNQVLKILLKQLLTLIKTILLVKKLKK